MKIIHTVLILLSLSLMNCKTAYCPTNSTLLIVQNESDALVPSNKVYYSSLKDNNPFNIRTCATNNWIGKLPYNQAEFEKFTNLEFGIRAGLKCLWKYQDRLPTCTVESIINTLAPPHENDTEAYIAYICKSTGFNRYQVLDLRDKDTIVKIATEIIYIETGKPIHPLQIENVFLKYFT